MSKTLLEVLSENDIILHESGEKWVAHCPFHKGDREPSFTVYPNNTYYCFGCRVWGNPVKFLVDFKGMSAEAAILEVGQDYAFPKQEKRGSIKIKNMLKTSKFLYEVAVIYHEYLLEQSGPLKYLLERGLTEETIKKYMIGYTDGAVLGLSFAEEYTLANDVGLINKNGYEVLSHRITFPNIVDRQFCDFMIGRTVINDKIKYLGLRMPKPIMGFYDVRKSPIIFLVEGQFDYLVLRQWGYPAVVMSGAHLSKSNYMLLRDRTVIIIPDNDFIGIKAAKELNQNLSSSIILDWSKLGVKDIGDLVLVEGAKDSFNTIVNDALCLRPELQKYLPVSEVIL